MTFDTAPRGHIAEGYESIADRLAQARSEDPEHSFQLAVYQDRELVVDLYGGEGIQADSLMVPFSVSKAAVAFSVALLIDRGELDLDAAVAQYWPAFAGADKHHVTVRELLSHQVGLPEATPVLTDEEFFDARLGGERLAAELPWWRPGSAFGYHAVTIGTLASELVRSVTGMPLQQFYESEIRAPRNIDFFLGLPEKEEHRVVELQAGFAPAQALESVPFNRRPAQIGRTVFGARPFHPGDDRALARRQRAAGAPGVHATVSARGIAALYAESCLGVTGSAMISRGTRARMAQSQVYGIDRVIGIERDYGIVFQKPTAALDFGGFRAFGHDGAGGALGFHDPETGISFGYTVRRTPPPGGADPRALEIAALIGDLRRRAAAAAPAGG